jgi:multidrug efflux pump subunit AcrB
VEGFDEVTNGQEDADQTLHLVIDRDKAMRLGLTTAQIYAQIAGDLTTEKTSVTVTIDDKDMDVVVVNENDLPTKETLLDEVFDVTVTNDDGEQETEEHKLEEFAKLETADGFASISRSDNSRYMTVSATTMDGYNTTRLSEQAKALLEAYDMPDGYSFEISGEYENVTDMMTQMLKMIALGFLFIYLIMVAQFQSLLSPFIVLFTVPLAFTGGFFGLLAMGEQLSLFSMMGFMVLMGTVVNNGIVFVDYTNQLRLGGMRKRDALIATGKTRMRPILMTALTTILSMGALVFDSSTSAGMSRGMAVVVAGGLIYATLMTLFIIPVMYDILYRRQPKEVDVGSDDLDDVPDDAAEFIAQLEENSHS